MFGVRGNYCSVLTLLGASLVACGSVEEHAPERGTTFQPITNSNLTNEPAGVVALASAGNVMCTGVVVSPRLVLTAAHCLRVNPPDQVIVGDPESPSQRGSVIKSWMHPDYRVGSPEHDLALLLVAEPILAPQIAINTTSVTAESLGKELEVVGFGRTIATTRGTSTKRLGLSTLIDVSPSTITLGPSPSLPCSGDSGGPVLAFTNSTPLLWGIISKGDEHCGEWSRAVRVDTAYATFLEPILARVERKDGSAGQSCSNNTNCASGICLKPSAAPDFAYCSSACVSDADCDADMHCVERAPGEAACELKGPTPGGLGAACESAHQCQFQMCAQFAPTAPSICSKLCFPDSPNSCGADGECHELADTPGSFGCRTPEQIDIAPSACSVTRPSHGSRRPWLGLWPAIAAAAYLWRRSRR